MTPNVYAVELFALAWIGLLALGSLIAAIAVRVCQRRLALWEPRARHRALVLLVSLPLLVASVLMLSAVLRALVSLIVPGADHCVNHDGDHPHLCFVHLPSVPVSTWLVMLMMLGPYVPTSLETVAPRYLCSDGRRMDLQACRSHPMFLVEKTSPPRAGANGLRRA